MPIQLPAGTVRIRSSLNRVADAWEMVVAGSERWRNALATDTVNVSIGYEDEQGDPAYVTVLKNAPVDERELQFQPRQIVTVLRGRDATAALLDREVSILYVRAPDRTPISQITPSIVTTRKVGFWTASAIARDLLVGTGVDLVWQVRDYQLREDFDATGRIIDLIRRLVEPWSLTEVFKVDVLLDGFALLVRHRSDPSTGTGNDLVAQAEYSYSVKSAKVGTVTPRRRRTDVYGVIRLEGQRSGQGGTENDESGGGAIWLVGLEITRTAYDDHFNGKELVARLETKTTTVYPDAHVTKIVNSTYGGAKLRLISRETTDNDYEQSVYAEGRVVNSPKLRATIVSTEETRKGVFQTSRQEIRSWVYDGLGFLQSTAAVRSELNTKTLALDRKTMRTERFTDVQPLVYLVQSGEFQWSKKIQDWSPVRRQEVPASGYRPGGPGRAGAPVGGAAGTDPNENLAPVVLEETLSTAPEARYVRYSNPNLTLTDLKFIRDQLAAASGLWENELLCEGASMPWLRRGMRWRLTAGELEDGSVFQTPPMLVVDVDLVHNEMSRPKQSVMDLTCLYWQAVPA